MNIPLTSYIRTRWINALEKLEFGRLHFITPEGERLLFHGPKEGPEATFQIAEWGVIRRMIARGDIAMGEDYIAGKWETDSIERLFSLFLMNFDKVASFANGNAFNRLLFLFNNRVLHRNSRSGSKGNIKAHYDVGNDFYSLWLDETMTYSSALFTGAGDDLAQGQRNKYQRIIDKTERDGASMLEVGCGWGGFAEQASGANHHVTGLTVSQAQHDFATKRLRGSADIRLQDYRDVKGDFDMIVSIEMFEAVGENYWPTYFKLLGERMKKGGKAVIQTIAIDDALFADYKTRSDFIRHYVFPGGMLPSLQRFKEEAARAGLKCIDAFSFGQDYAETLRRWNERFDAQRNSIKSLGHSDAFIRNWQFYLGICTAAFAVGRTNVAQMELVHA